MYESLGSLLAVLAFGLAVAGLTWASIARTGAQSGDNPIGVIRSRLTMDGGWAAQWPQFPWRRWAIRCSGLAFGAWSIWLADRHSGELAVLWPLALGVLAVALGVILCEIKEAAP